MVQRRGRPGLLPKTFLELVEPCIGSDDLERDEPVEGGVVGGVHLAHASSPKLLAHHIPTDAAAGGKHYGARDYGA